MAVSFIDGWNLSTWRKPPTCRKSLINFITYCWIEYTSSWAGFKLTTLVVIGTDCTYSCKSNYHTITTTPIYWLYTFCVLFLKIGSRSCNTMAVLVLRHLIVIHTYPMRYNSYMIYIIRNPILWLGISACGGGVFVRLFFKRRCSPDYFFRNVNKMAAWIPDDKKKIKETMFIVNNRQLLLHMK